MYRVREFAERAGVTVQGPMQEQVVRVECYSGYKGDERPLRLILRDGTREVLAVEDRWYSPGATFFRILVHDGDRYLLRHEEAQDVWTLAGYRAAAKLLPSIAAP
jgi:hypothetical protein